jgi:hypothetical protein
MTVGVQASNSPEAKRGQTSFVLLADEKRIVAAGMRSMILCEFLSIS